LEWFATRIHNDTTNPIGAVDGVNLFHLGDADIGEPVPHPFDPFNYETQVVEGRHQFVQVTR
jgi:hypothetical protein